MPETNETYQPLTFDAIKIGLASPEKILEWSHGEVKKPACSVRESLDRARTGSATVVNIKKSATKVLSVTAAALRLQKPASAVSAWVISSLQLRFPTSGISREFRAGWV